MAVLFRGYSRVLSLSESWSTRMEGIRINISDRFKIEF